MQDRPFISVIVPSYNRADLLPQTLKSLQGQDYDNFEIIIVDDGSTDNTEQVIRSITDKRTRYVRKSNEERAAARNCGGLLARGTYLNFFDSDDIALPNHLSEAAKLISERSEPEWFHLGFAWATPEGRIFKKANNFEGKTLNDIMTNGNPLSCAGVFVRKDIFMQNLFNEDRDLSASEDYELWMRLAARFPLYYTNNITSLLIDHGSRSVRTIHGQRLIKRLELLITYLEKDQLVMERFHKKFNRVICESRSYIALHLADFREFKLKSLEYLLRALYSYPALVLDKRLYAILRNWLLTWRSSKEESKSTNGQD